MKKYYNPDQERRWAAERQACLLRACLADPNLANGFLARQDREESPAGKTLFEALAAWIAAHPAPGKDFLDRWDRIQPKSRTGGVDPHYAAAIRHRAREIYFNLKDHPCQEST